MDLPVARVLPLLGMPHLDRLFDYAVPEELDASAVAGVRVRVRFAGRLVDAVVIERRRASDHSGRLAPLSRVLGETPVVPPQLWDLVNRLADRYAGVRSDILRACVPSRHASAEKAGLFGDGGSWEDLYGALESPQDLGDVARGAALENWSAYRHADSLINGVLDGRAVRASWLWTPGEDWPTRIAELAAAVAWSGGGVLLVAPNQREVDRITGALRQFLAAAQITELSAAIGPQARYRRYLAVLAGQGRVVVGTRSAATAPVQDLRLVVLVGESDESLVDPRAPYIHAREVLRMRAEAEGFAFIVGGAHRSAEIQAWVEEGFLPTLRPTPEALAARMPWVHGLDDIFDAHASFTRLPAAGFAAVRRTLEAGLPALIQVPRRGYAPALACTSCRTSARCRRCNGPLELPGGSGDEAAAPRCRWCGAIEGHFTCTTCGGHALRMTVIGQDRTAEELGRAFTGIPVTVSGGSQIHPTVPAGARLVVATTGAEPVAKGGYGCAVVLDPWLSLNREDLRAAENALDRWMEMTCLVVPRDNGGEVLVVSAPDVPAVQALIRWDPEGAASRELASRREAHLPPAVVFVAVDGTPESLTELREAWESRPESAGLAVEFLGPVELPGGVRLPAGLGEQEAHRARRLIIRAAGEQVEQVGAALRAAQAVRATHRQSEPLRVVVDPVRVG
ncbi:primosomal protein N' [Corynebacterium terpenotabidum]|uniref:Probable replication restart protein PriA n=1 Tax=Corynebacterium terpenotabidum Y-11 TaxID=1200352 RepID=S4XCH6_9CORY|nr:primosomal protein N' [Corynebacterium terpenotabidum]AGP30827.1 primosome assembly protein PriA [Corynebacterium terpenotabidum Y-11]